MWADDRFDPAFAQSNLTVIPASCKVHQRAMAEGLSQVFIDAGANV